MTETSPLKICFIAFCCEPGRGSEWGLGWSYVQEISRTQPVWVVVHDECRPALDKFLAEQHTGHPIYPIYVGLPGWLAWMRNSFYSVFNIYYYLWQFAAAKALRRLHDRVQLDLVQHVSLCRWWMPSAGAAIARRGAAFIFGPVGGGELLPSKFRNRVPVMGKVADALRFVGRTVCRRDPFLVRTIRDADLLVAAIPPVKEWFAKYVDDEVEIDCASCCSAPEVLSGATFARETRSTHGPFTFASCGGLSYFRGVDLAIRAFAKADIPNSRYVHACDGPMRPSLEALARELGIGGRVIFLGDIPHTECVKAMVSADVGVHTVLRDSAGVLPDALYAGLPFITLNHLTPSMLVTPDCGLLIPIREDSAPAELVDAIAQAMRDCHANPDMVAAKSAAAKDRGRELLPDNRGAQIRAMHDRAMRKHRLRTPGTKQPVLPRQASSITTASSR